MERLRPLHGAHNPKIQGSNPSVAILFNKMKSTEQELKERRKKAYNKWYSKKENREKQIKGIKERSKKNQQWLNTYKKDKKCEICGQSHISTLDFHHKNPNKKEDNVVAYINCYSIQRLQEEINKCEILCANCHIIKHKNEYIKNHNNSKQKEKRLQKILEAKKLLGNKCIECGEQNTLCLEFHHRNKSEKSDCISELIGGGCSKKRIQNELKKCDLLCRNCHRILHYNKRTQLLIA